MAEQNHQPENMEDTRRGIFIQELLDSGRKSGDYLDGQTTKLPEIPAQQPAETEEPTAMYEPVQEPSEEDYDAGEAYDNLYDDAYPEEEPDIWDTGDLQDRGGGVLLPALRAAIFGISVLLGAVLLALAVWLAADDVFGLTDGDRVVTITVAETDTVKDVAEKLKSSGLIKFKPLFRLYCALTNGEKKIDPGVYELNDYYDYMALVNGMIATSDDRKTVTVTIPEGYEVAQILRLLADNGAADYDALCDAAANYAFDYAFLADIPYGDVNRLEGYLFPDTYEFYVDDDAERVLGKFLKNFDNKFTDDLYERLNELNALLQADGLATPLTQRDVLAVASMIEKEAATSGERTSIASVIYNRLCSSSFPYLQIDATVQYALGERKPTLTYADLAVDSPYNTYVYEGLPAGPIACPGLNSIKAALYPANTEFYYYALDRDGTHHFSKTRLEHEEFLASMEQTP